MSFYGPRRVRLARYATPEAVQEALARSDSRSFPLTFFRSRDSRSFRETATVQEALDLDLANLNSKRKHLERLENNK